MKLPALLLASLLTAWAGISHAGYANVSPPPEFAKTSDGLFYRAAANTPQFQAGVARVSGSIFSGSQRIVVPAALRVAANAPGYAAALVYRNPSLALGVTIAGILAEELIEYNPGGWFAPDHPANYTPSTGLEYATTPNYGWFFSKDAACLQYTSTLTATSIYNYTYDGLSANGFACRITLYRKSDGSLFSSGTANLSQRSSTVCPSGWFVTAGGVCIQTPQPVQIPEEDFVTRVAPLISPAQVPEVIPGLPVPVEIPRINPADDPDLTPQPLYNPLGEPRPVPNPAYPADPDAPPAIYQQPWERITPAPTFDNPWRIDIRPEVRSSPDLAGLAVPVSGPQLAPQQDLETCGLPGTPPCKIDETGTPEQVPDDGIAVATGILQTLQACADNLSGCLPAMPDISWTFSLPTGCAPIVLGGGFQTYVEPIDICQWQPMFHDLMSMIWAGVGLFGAVALFRPRGN